MSSRIRVLPPELASQIAAGEVIERPASVVKELVENSLDAEARRIEVDIEGGGLQLIRICDDGFGMNPEEASLALERHATSKLTKIEDLSTLVSMGFRGEALPSIAAVSRLTLTTRTATREAASRLTIEAGKELGPQREVGGAVGTVIEVRDLLFNVPARLKFMKSEATESGQVVETLLRLALVHPQVHFRLRTSGRVVLDLPSHGDGLARVRASLANRGKGVTLYPSSGEEFGYKVEAYLGDPAETTATPRNVYLFMNRRFIRDRSLLHSVGLAYGEILDRGRYPLAVVHISVPPEEVDVNVHPQKLEVRFLRPQDVYSAVRHTLRETIQRAPWLLTPTKETQYDLEELLNRKPPGPSTLEEDQPDASPMPEAREERPSYGMPAGLQEHQQRLQQALNLNRGSPTPSPAGAVANGGRRFFSDMQYLGQYRQTYLLCEHNNELLLIDQHAAHERLAYERLRASHGKEHRSLRSQRLLLPLSIELDPERAALCEESLDLLNTLGFSLRLFGPALSGQTVVIDSMPDAAEFGRGAKTYQDPERLFAKVMDDLLQHGSSETVAARLDRVLATVACHSVVRAGDVLDMAHAKALLSTLDEVEFCPYCPHGRPVLVRMSSAEVERRFGRT